LALAPNDTDSLNNLAYIFAENLNRPAEALPYARRAVELAPRNADVLDTLGWVQYLAGDTDGALGTLVSALQLSPNHIAGRYHVGMVYRKKADPGQAKREFEHAQDLIKGNPVDAIAKMFEERVRKALLELAGGNVAGK
jgi:tetratricopeptide (TPR) repeat protein